MSEQLSKRKITMCVNWTKSKTCPYGFKCQFAHGENELNFYLSRYKKNKKNEKNKKRKNEYDYYWDLIQKTVGLGKYSEELNLF